jgi:hypothetical protein
MLCYSEKIKEFKKKGTIKLLEIFSFHNQIILRTQLVLRAREVYIEKKPFKLVSIHIHN